MNQESEYLHRYADDWLAEMFPILPAISIDGPKGVGKTATASRHVDAVLPLDDPDVLRVIELRGREAFTTHPTICIDEWQYYPSSWNLIRRLVDAKSSSRFLLTGSATPAPGARLHSGAGRIISYRMRPMSLAERGVTRPRIAIASLLKGEAIPSVETDFTVESYAQEICASGFPGIRLLPEKAIPEAIASYIDRIAHKEIAEMGRSIYRPQAVKAWLASYGAASSTTTSYAKILDAATPLQGDKPSRQTSETYRELLANLWILDPIPAWLPAATPLKRLTSAPKHQLCDSALAAGACGFTPQKLLSHAPGAPEFFGQLFESFAALTLRAAAPTLQAEVFHLRTRGGEHEVDLILETRDGSVAAFEVKLATHDDDSDGKHLRWLGEHLGERLSSKNIITAGSYAYTRPDGINVIPLAELH